MSVAKVTINGTTILDLTDATATSGSDVVSPKTAYSPTGTKLTGTAEAVNNQSKSATYTPTTQTQTRIIQPDSGYTGLSSVSVKINSIPSNYIDTTDATASAADINSGATAYVNGSKLTGTQIIQVYRTGSGAPSSSLGNNGDLYFQTGA